MGANILFYAKANNLGGALPPEDPEGTPEWISIFDNTIWQTAGETGSNIYWDSPNNRFVVEDQVGGGHADLEPIGTWYQDFRPDQVRITLVTNTFDLVNDMDQVDLNVGANNNDTTGTVSNTIWTSSADLAGANIDDISLLMFYTQNTVTGIFYITNIEFYYDTSNPPDSGGAWPGGTGGGE